MSKKIQSRKPCVRQLMWVKKIRVGKWGKNSKSKTGCKKLCG